jgi:hypothetical protein
MRLSSTTALAALSALLVPSCLFGQFSQYTQPGSLGSGAGEAVDREQMDQAIEDARWQAGPLRLEPWIGLRDLAWNDNPGGSTEGDEGDGDVSAAVGAGLRGYLPTGRDVVWAVHALPEYLWYADDDARRRVNGRYGAGVFGFFNRLTLEATARRTEKLAILSVELPEQGNTREDVFAVAGDLELGFSTWVFVEAARNEVRNLLNREERATGSPLDRLDRDEDRLRAGVRYRPRERWSVAAGVEWTETAVLSEERDLSSSGEAPAFEIEYQGPQLTASAAVELRTLQPEGDSIFPETDETTAALHLGLEGNRLSPALYAQRTLSLALSEGYSHFATDLVGAGATLELGYRTDLRLFVETGRSEFTALSAEVPAREDDLIAFGGELGFTLGRSLRLRLGGHRSEFDSNLPEEDRSVTVLSTGVSLGFGRDEGGGGWP